MAMSQSMIEKGSDETDESVTSKANTATKNKVIDFCTFCIPRDKHQPATYFCFECGPFGRYMCGTCEQNHEMFRSDHTIKLLTEAKSEPRHHEHGHEKSRVTEVLQTKTKELEERNKENSDLRKELEQLQKQLKEERKTPKVLAGKVGGEETAKVKDTLLRTQAELETKTNDIAKLSEELKVNRQKLEAEQSRFGKLDEEREKLKRDKDSAENKLVLTAKELEIAKRESHIFRSRTRAPSDEWITKINAAEAELKKERDLRLEKEKEITRLGKANQNENDLRAKLRKETEMKDKYKEDIQALTEKRNDAHEKLNLQQEEINELHRQKAFFQNEIKKLLEENKSLHKELVFQKQKYDEDMKAKNKQLEELKIEKDDRFSKMAGDRLTDKNADIADLSDPNRAMKLAEKFSGLYDDEWTDAFQTLCDNKMPKRDALQLLVRILKSCYDSCEFIATQQIATLTDNLVSPVQTVGKVTKEQAGIKTKPRLGSKNERILKDARRQMWEASIDLIKQSLSEQTKEWMDKEIGQKAFEDIQPYTEKCVEICWLMVIHEPPIYMKTETTPDENIDILVWPPLYNGKGGGLLSKGVVELIKTVKK